jgi:hypothetical protein
MVEAAMAAVSTTAIALQRGHNLVLRFRSLKKGGIGASIHLLFAFPGYSILYEDELTLCGS